MTNELVSAALGRFFTLGGVGSRLFGIADGARLRFDATPAPAGMPEAKYVPSWPPNPESSPDPEDHAIMHWSPERLRALLDNELFDAEVVVVSNREPYAHETRDGAIELETPASGLVSALEPILRTCGGIWIAHGSGSADRQTVDANDRIAVPPDNPAYTLRRVWLSEEEHKGHYFGAANEGLWPLCHIAFTRPMFRTSDWESYRAVNRKFADTVLEEVETDCPIVLVQDYHFALLPRLIRERLPKAIIITFWHIPWPNAEVFSVCPWREEILDGLLGSSIVGFHIQPYCSNFLDSIDRCLELRTDRATGTVVYRGEQTSVNAYPISVEWPRPTGDGRQAAAAARSRVLRRFDLPADMKIAVGVERLDYTKGVLDRFRALDEFFHQHSDWIGRLAFLQVAAPSRGGIACLPGIARRMRRTRRPHQQTLWPARIQADHPARQPSRKVRSGQSLSGGRSLRRLQPA